jgi:hypothetical protein
MRGLLSLVYNCLLTTLHLNGKTSKVSSYQLTFVQLTPPRVGTGFSRPAMAELAGTERKQR